MKSEYIPTVVIVLEILLSIPYVVKGNIRMAIYWIAAAMITACVTFTGGEQ
jgi:hypothetical protein